MSWFQDLAGKAEDFLNKVDQSAAHALHKQEKKKSRNTTNSYDGSTCMTEIESNPMLMSSLSVPYNLNHYSSSHQSNELSGISVQPVRLVEKNQDQTLLDYLNSGDESQNFSIEKEHTNKCNGQHAVNGFELSPDIVNEIPNGHLHETESEKQLLHNEVKSLNQEMIQALNRAKASEKEQQVLKIQNDGLKTQVTNLTKQSNELASHMNDIKNTVLAKDSQLGVMKVRLNEADEELKIMKEKLAYFLSENDRLKMDCSDSSGSHSQIVNNLSNKLEDTERVLEQEREEFQRSHLKYMDSISQSEAQQKIMTAKILDYERRLREERQLSEDNRILLQQCKQQLEAQRADFQDYKIKAQRILQSKESLLTELKQKGTVNVCDDKDIYEAELDHMRQEKDLLRQELEQLNLRVIQLQSDLSESESQTSTQANQASEEINSLQELLLQQQNQCQSLEGDLRYEKEAALNSRKEFMYNEKRLNNLLSDKDREIQSLRRQLTTKQLSSSTEEELEARLKALTESLIQKQTMLETLSTEKNSLLLQLERIESHKSECVSSRSLGSVSTNSTDDAKARVPSFMAESPYDGKVTRNVKRAYSSLDMFSMRIGVFFRRFPIARVFILLYMGLLHLWVLCVLLTYTPEIHSP